MYLRRRLREFVENALGVMVLRADVHGCLDYKDFIRTGLPVSMIFDVGANIGQSAEKFLKAFPKSTIHCFEPVSAPFHRLQERFGADPRAHLHQFALGAADGKQDIYLRGATTHSLVLDSESTSKETVHIKTLDGVMREAGIEKIDLLKVDVEGFEMSVFAGAAEVFAQRRVGAVIVEVGFDPAVSDFTQFSRINEFMHKKGMKFFGLYNQTLDYAGERQIRYADACYVL